MPEPHRIPINKGGWRWVQGRDKPSGRRQGPTLSTAPSPWLRWGLPALFPELGARTERCSLGGEIHRASLSPWGAKGEGLVGERGRGHGALRKEADSSDHAGRLLGTSLAPPQRNTPYKRGLLSKVIGKKCKMVTTMGKPENKFLPPRNDVEAPGYAAHVLFNSESTKESKKE